MKDVTAQATKPTRGRTDRRSRTGIRTSQAFISDNDRKSHAPDEETLTAIAGRISV